MKTRWIVILVLLLIGLVVAGYIVHLVSWNAKYYVVESTDYNPPPKKDDDSLVDDNLNEKNPAFDETLIDSRPLEDWQLNASAAVIRLDCPMIKPDSEADLLELRPSYADAMKHVKELRSKDVFLPSANMLDGAAKQFDDGLYAAIDLACYRGEIGSTPAIPQWISEVFERLPAGSPARPFLAAALELSGKEVPLSAAEKKEKDRWLADFEQNKAESKPISFYEWTPELKQTWRVFRFLQHEFGEDHLAVPRDVAAVLKDRPELRASYQAINAFYGRLTNPLVCLSVVELINARKSLPELAKQYGARHESVAQFPPSTSRETELFERLFPESLPADANLMAVLVRRIRSGEVDLKPGDKDGWYQHQVYALETMLLPTKGQEKEKLLLTAEYKKRLVEAFKALVTKRRETHARQLSKGACCAKEIGEGALHPRLRIEPCATFYLRTARAYSFLNNFLQSAVGTDRLNKMHGLKQGGRREKALDVELNAVRQRFYGFYLIACEDVGMKPELLADEAVDQPAARQAALKWLESLESNPDLACDTRVSVPIAVDPIGQKTRLWATLGVRLAHLEASYAKSPKVRPKAEGGAWKELERYQLGNSSYVIPVDEFAEFEMDGLNALTREEFWNICDQCRTKEKIMSKLGER